jgi:Rieske Fe-S protein
MSHLDRRTVLRGACVGCAGLALAACGGGSTTDSAAGDAAPGPASGSSSGPASAAPPKPLATLADLKVDASVAARAPDGRRMLLTRVSETSVVAFSAKCTHQGCTVEPDGAKLACPCHGSVYDARTGKVLRGPAPAPLPAIDVVVTNGAVFVA